MKKILLVLLTVILALAAYLFYYLGAWKGVALSIEEQGPLHMIYKEHLGAYHKIVPVIEEVEKWAKSQGLNCEKSFGEYMDDPQQVEQERLRSHGGCLVDKIPQVLPDGYQSEVREVHLYGVARFEGSPAIGPWKVYSKLARYITDERHEISGPMIEIYEFTGPNSLKTTYLFPVK